MPLNLTLTAAGIAEITNAVGNGTDPVLISEIGIGDGQYTPDGTESALVNEIKRLNTIAGVAVADDTLHVTIRDESADIYSVGEIGLYTDSGTLLGIIAQDAGSGWIIEKAAPTVMLIAADIILTSINASSLNFGDVNFINPQATETVKGVAEVATQAETDAGTDDERIVTPKKLKNWVKQATESVLGMLKVATQTQTDSGTDDTVAVTPKKLRSGFLISLASNGYIVFPTWLSGLIIQWGNATATDKNNIYFNIAFPNECLNIMVTEGTTSSTPSSSVVPLGYEPDTITATRFKVRIDGGSSAMKWLAIGY